MGLPVEDLQVEKKHKDNKDQKSGPHQHIFRGNFHGAKIGKNGEAVRR
jgi:hypothetical protein